MDITLVAVMDNNRVIGSGDGRPMFVGQHAAWLKKYVQGKVVVMGRKTHHAMGGPIPGADNIVLTRNFAVSIASFNDVSTALALDGVFISAFDHKQADNLVVLGGASTFHAFYPWATQMHITHVRADIQGDRYFPSYPGWRPGLINDRYEQGDVLFERIDYRRDDYHEYPSGTHEDLHTLRLLNAMRHQRGYRELRTESPFKPAYVKPLADN